MGSISQDADAALVVVDMQNLFVDLVGEIGPGVVEAVNRHVAYAVESDRPVYYTRDYAPVELPEGDPEGKTDLHPGLDFQGPVVPKGPGKQGGFSGFVLSSPEGPHDGPGTGGLSPLAGLLRQADVRSVIVVGIAADVCVAATARDARRLGYLVTVPLSATAFVHAHPDGDEKAMAELRAAGVTVAEAADRHLR
jgi:nicotinamidase/pyrazinamidase